MLDKSFLTSAVQRSIIDLDCTTVMPWVKLRVTSSIAPNPGVDMQLFRLKLLVAILERNEAIASDSWHHLGFIVKHFDLPNVDIISIIYFIHFRYKVQGKQAGFKRLERRKRNSETMFF